MNLRLWIPGEPVTWARPENNRYGGRHNKPEHEAQMEAIRWVWRSKGMPKLCGTLVLTVRAYLHKPKSCRRIAPSGQRDGDWDNYAKLVCDALQDKPERPLCYPNDCVILFGGCGKWWAELAPGTEMLLTETDVYQWDKIGKMSIERMLGDWNK